MPQVGQILHVPSVAEHLAMPHASSQWTVLTFPAADRWKPALLVEDILQVVRVLLEGSGRPRAATPSRAHWVGAQPCPDLDAGMAPVTPFGSLW